MARFLEYAWQSAPAALVIYWLITGRLQVGNEVRFTVLTPFRSLWHRIQFRRNRKRFQRDLQEILSEQ